jgi:hypothetical protein
MKRKEFLDKLKREKKNERKKRNRKRGTKKISKAPKENDSPLHTA